MPQMQRTFPPTRSPRYVLRYNHECNLLFNNRVLTVVSICIDRHMARHKEKDDEAGGEGLGVLATRKRLWRDTDGNIVNARRPSYTGEQGSKRRMVTKSSHERKDSKLGEHERKMSLGGLHTNNGLPPSPVSMTRADSARSTIIVDTNGRQQLPPPQMYPMMHEVQPKIEHDDYNRAPWYQSTHIHSHSHSHSSSSNSGPSLLSPTNSNSTYSEPESSLQSESQSPAAELDTLYEDAWPMHNTVLPQILNHSPPMSRESEYPASPGWGPQPSFQTFMGAIGEYEEPKQVYGGGHHHGVLANQQEMNGMYGWQNPWNVGSQIMLSRVREEKFDPMLERSSAYPDPSVMRHGFGMR